MLHSKLECGLPEVVICTLGTRGDILPFLALARQLRQKSFSVTILTNNNWAELVRSVGADFVDISDPDPPQDGRDDFQFFRSHTFPSFARCFSYIQSRYDAGAQCILVYRMNMVGAECAAVRFGFPNIKVALQPSAIRSFEFPPWPLMKLTQGPLATVSKRYLLPLLFAIWEARYRKFTNEFRESVGVAPLPVFRDTRGPEHVLLLLCPQWFSMPQRDWPGTVRFAGFPYFDASLVQDKELASFIGSKGNPIVFTAGTGVRDGGWLFSAAKEICVQLKCPVIFLGGGIDSSESSENLLVKAYAELHSLLPRSALLVHHGGIGTTAQAIRAGVPQCIIPGRFDQPDNAFRVAVFGLGGAIFSKRPRGDEITTAIRTILESVRIRETSQRAAEIVASEDGVARMCKAVVELAAMRKDHAVPLQDVAAKVQPI